MSRKSNNIKKYYNNKALSYGIHARRLQNIVKLLKNLRSARILDVSCATGYVGFKLKQQGNYVVGVDISDKAVAKAKKVLDEAYVVDIENDPLTFKRKFDVIILSEIIEHLFQPRPAVGKLVRLLKSKGKMLITTPNILYWGNRINFLLGSFVYDNHGHFDESHVHFFTYHSLIKLIADHQLKIIAVNHVTSGPFSRLLVNFFPGVLAYQFVILVEKE